MAQTIAWTSNTVPGSLSVTGNPRDSGAPQPVSGRCPRCERWPSEQKCSGVLGDPVHLGS